MVWPPILWSPGLVPYRYLGVGRESQGAGSWFWDEWAARIPVEGEGMPTKAVGMARAAEIEGGGRLSNASDGLASALTSLIGVPCKRLPGHRLLKLSFDFRHQAKGRAYIWIDPPWRLTNGRRFVAGSYDWPRWDGIEDPRSTDRCGRRRAHYSTRSTARCSRPPRLGGTSLTCGFDSTRGMRFTR